MEITSRVLLVDDEPNVLISLSRILRRRGFDVTIADSAAVALEKVHSGRPEACPFDVVVVDLKMPDMDGLQLLKEIRSRTRRLPVVVLTGYGTIRSAVDAMQNGAFEYLVKPSTPEEIISVLQRAARSARAAGAAEGDGSRTGSQARDGAGIVGSSAALLALLRLVDRVAALPLAVLLQGESGTGKELIARSIHAKSPRSARPFVAVNCSTVAPTLAESLFFGHRKGTFTGADSDRSGFFQAAQGGTLFLDEVGDFPEAAQGVLLRALQEGNVTPVGATTPFPVDVRIVSATHRDLEADVRAGRFRADLYYRLNVVQLGVPPLRERPEDIRPLAESFVAECRAGFGFGPAGISEPVMSRFLVHAWPGNVRELRNVIERAFAVCEGDSIETSNLPGYLQGEPQGRHGLSALDAVERRQIQAALAATGGEKKAAAELLGIERKRLYRKLKRLGLFG
jgi:DNA-binding NtrC family response regulator